MFIFFLQLLWYSKVSNKYITECAWSTIAPNRLAISSLDNEIHLFTTCTNGNDKDIVHVDGKLIGHKLGVNQVKWSNHNENRLVSCSNDCTVRVWDTEKFECISLVTYSARMHFATFSPNDANLILATGFGETMHIFDVRNHLFVNEIKEKNSCDSIENDFKWATEIGINNSKEIAKEKKKQKKRKTTNEGEIASTSATAAVIAVETDSNNVDEMLSEAMESVSLAPIQVHFFFFFNLL